MLYEIPDNPKMLRETLAFAQACISNARLFTERDLQHINRLQRLIDECDKHRPLGPNGKHGGLHTGTCGCEDKGSFTVSEPSYIAEYQESVRAAIRIRREHDGFCTCSINYRDAYCPQHGGL